MENPLNNSINELNLQDVAHFSGIELESEKDKALLMTIMKAAEGFIISNTGLTAEEINNFPELNYVFFTLCSEMFNNRDYTATKDKLNPTAECILNMHARNLIAGGADCDSKQENNSPAES